MPHDLSISLPPIIGQVVEIYNDEAKSTAKIALKGCHIELPLSLLDDAHLDDEIRLDIVVTSDRIHTIHTNGLISASRPDAPIAP